MTKRQYIVVGHEAANHTAKEAKRQVKYQITY